MPSNKAKIPLRKRVPGIIRIICAKKRPENVTFWKREA